MGILYWVGAFLCSSPSRYCVLKHLLAVLGKTICEYYIYYIFGFPLPLFFFRSPLFHAVSLINQVNVLLSAGLSLSLALFKRLRVWSCIELSKTFWWFIRHDSENLSAEGGLVILSHLLKFCQVASFSTYLLDKHRTSSFFLFLSWFVPWKLVFFLPLKKF